MGRLFLQYLDEGRKYACKECLAGCIGGQSVVHLAAVSDLLSKSFHSRHGPAYLFTNAVNVTLGKPEERDMTTGKHIVRDLFCISCGTNLGWRYEMAHEQREKYKEGKYILERLQLVDLEAAPNVYARNTIATYDMPLLNSPPPPHSQLLLSTSAMVTTAAVPGRGGTGASPTGVMAMMTMPENASPISSSGERSPLGVHPPPPPPPARSLRFGFHQPPPQWLRRRREEADEETHSPSDSMPEVAELPDIRAFFSNWAPSTTTTPAAGAGDTDTIIPPAITDAPPPHFNIDL